MSFLKIYFIIITALSFYSREKIYFFDESNWFIEQEDANSTFRILNGDTIEMISPKGQTAWLKSKLIGNYEINYKACIVVNQGEYDRLSDLNCFWAASDPNNPNNLFAQEKWRNGFFPKYYSLNLYYVGYGGNENKTTRFRKYDGNYLKFIETGEKPKVIKEYNDLDHLLKPNQWYNIKIVMKENRVQYYVDGELLFDLFDEKVYTEGYFALRGVRNHMQITGIDIKTF